MCESNPRRGMGWQGWITLPEREAGAAVGPWLDLSHPIGPATPCASIFPPPETELIRAMPDDPFNVTRLNMVVHAGTHLDSPRHYYLDGPAFEDIPLDRLHGPGTIWRIDVQPNAVIGVEQLEEARPVLREGDILALETGWSNRVGTETYDQHPSLSPEAGEWLVSRRIKLLACDFATPDLVYHLREEGFDWPIHRALLSRGILICEHLTGHRTLAGKRVEFMFNALNISAADGAPVRALAREVL